MNVLWNRRAWNDLTRPGRAVMRTGSNIVFDGEWFEDDFGHRFFACENGGKLTIGYGGNATYNGPVSAPSACCDMFCDDPSTLAVEVELGFVRREEPADVARRG